MLRAETENNSSGACTHTQKWINDMFYRMMINTYVFKSENLKIGGLEIVSIWIGIYNFFMICLLLHKIKFSFFRFSYSFFWMIIIIAVYKKTEVKN